MCLLLGISFKLNWNFSYFLIFPILWISSSKKNYKSCFFRIFTSIIIASFGYIYTSSFFTSSISSPQKGKGYFSISTVSPSTSFFRSGYIFKGKLRSFHTDDGKTLSNIPCSVFVKGKRPLANKDYLISGLLIQGRSKNFILKSKEWIGVEKSSSFAEMRFSIKTKFRSLLAKKVKNSKTRNFLAALATGEIDEDTLRGEFGRLGLQHIMAISGFHFGFLILFCSFFLKKIFRRKHLLWILILIANAYYFFIGPSPSVQRAWIMIQLFLLGQILGKKSLSLNLIGVAMLIEIVLNPLIIQSLSFQLSFLACGGIFIFYSQLDNLFSKILKKRSKEEVKNLYFLHRQAHTINSYIRKSAALSFSVNLAIFPVLLFHFHKFPLFSLVYNLFFPLLVTLSLALLILSCTLFWIPPLSNFLFHLNDVYTTGTLNLTSHPPTILEFVLHGPLFSPTIYLLLLFFSGIILKKEHSKLII